jgi:hypothetical protein
MTNREKKLRRGRAEGLASVVLLTLVVPSLSLRASSEKEISACFAERRAKARRSSPCAIRNVWAF